MANSWVEEASMLRHPGDAPSLAGAGVAAYTASFGGLRSNARVLSKDP